MKRDKKTKTFNVNLDAPKGNRNVLIFMDGTWNDETGVDNNGLVTNIYKLFSCMKGRPSLNDVPHSIKLDDIQVAYYFRGIGNDEENSTVETYYEGTFGAGEKNIRDNAYSTIVKGYKPGDRLFIFGFSRGAACARLLATKLDKHGIPSQIKITTKKEKNKNTGKEESRFLKYKADDDHKPNVKVAFLGLFDTVGAFGIPIDIGIFNFQKLNLFKNLTLAGNVQQAVHLVSIDESREAFVPTLINVKKNVHEVWFPGVHSDVGGSYEEDEFGKVTLDYMVKKLKGFCGTGHPIQFDDNKLSKCISLDRQKDKFHLHHHGLGFKKGVRDIYAFADNKASDNFKPKIHKSVFDLITSGNGYLIEEEECFKKKTPISYRPQNVLSLKNRYEVVG